MPDSTGLRAGYLCSLGFYRTVILSIVPGYQCVNLLKIAYYSHCIGSVEPRGLSRIFGCPKTGKKGTFFIHNLSVSVKVVIVRVSELFNH